jgi:hypothetical protein
VGSSLFLKRQYGVGYQLTLVKDKECAVEQVKTLVETIPGAQLISNVGTELSFRLPIQSSGHFPAVLAELETAASQHGVLSYGIGVTTLEEVFLRVTMDADGQ